MYSQNNKEKKKQKILNIVLIFPICGLISGIIAFYYSTITWNHFFFTTFVNISMIAILFAIKFGKEEINSEQENGDREKEVNTQINPFVKKHKYIYSFCGIILFILLLIITISYIIKGFYYFMLLNIAIFLIILGSILRLFDKRGIDEKIMIIGLILLFIFMFWVMVIE